MKPELQRQVIAKLDAMYVRSVGLLSQGEAGFTEKQAKMAKKHFWINSPQRKQYERAIRALPDTDFEEVMANLDNFPGFFRKLVNENIVYISRNRGGRPPGAPLEVRRRAVQDLGVEYARCDTFKEAVDLVASRYNMTPDYLRKVWKNRRRLKES